MKPKAKEDIRHDPAKEARHERTTFIERIINAAVKAVPGFSDLFPAVASCLVLVLVNSKFYIRVRLRLGRCNTAERTFEFETQFYRLAIEFMRVMRTIVLQCKGS
jgi:hypothetical protein